MTTNANQIEIDVESVIKAAATTAVAQSHPDLTEEAVQIAVKTASEDPMYQLMINAVRPEAAAVILVRNAMYNARRAQP